MSHLRRSFSLMQILIPASLTAKIRHRLRTAAFSLLGLVLWQLAAASMANSRSFTITVFHETVSPVGGFGHAGLTTNKRRHENH